MTQRSAQSRVSGRRLQSATDAFATVLIAMLVWPFPVARALLDPWAHVAGVLATVVVMSFVYFVACMLVWGRTFGMRLAGLVLVSADDQHLDRRRAVRWAALSASVVWWFVVAPARASAFALAERASGTAMRAE